MSLIYNGTTVTGINYNGTTLTALIYNGITVWSGAPSSIDVLVVAGGGGAARSNDANMEVGNGGAGGLCYQTGRSISAGATYTVTVGGGGTGSLTYGLNGSNSVFDTITAIGGGGGAEGWNLNGKAGGSGGGAGNTGYEYGGSGGAALQGNSGGATGYGNRGSDSWYLEGRYGGGAGSDGNSGGAGRSYDISGSSVTYSMGSGGNIVSNWGPNKGHGGTGETSSNRDSTLDYGSSGVVILRYPNTYPTATVTGSPTYTNTGGYHIYKFTGSGTIRW